VWQDEAEPSVVAEGREKAVASRERSSERRRRCRAAELLLRLRERERGRERERRGANGSGDESGRGRALLVADQGASRLPHALHAAGPASASRPEVRPRPASAPLSYFHFLNFFS